MNFYFSRFFTHTLIASYALFLLSACSDAPKFSATEQLPGGETTLQITSTAAFNRPAAHLSASQRVEYFSGHSFFKNPWVSAPASTKARDGLGPLFNTNSCKACHVRNGRGSVSEKGIVLRLSATALSATNATSNLKSNDKIKTQYIADSTYGEQLQSRALPGLSLEAKSLLKWELSEQVLADETVIELRKPLYTINNWTSGNPDTGTQWSARIAPAMIGLGLLEAIPAAAIQAYANKIKGHGVAGKISWVQDKSTGNTAIGRFGWKALQPTVIQQSAKAFQQDMGLTSRLYPENVCTAKQLACQNLPDGVDEEHEVRNRVLEMVEYYARHVAVPAPRNTESKKFQQGREQFYLAGCADCHKPSWQTEPLAELSAQTIWPYTDLLLHNMGDGLAATTGEQLVSGSEWRTPPLWGIGLAKTVNPKTGFLHDGRARTLEEAILWHRGEAQDANNHYRNLNSDQRIRLLYFLNSL